jgi:hypothetical protein
MLKYHIQTIEVSSGGASAITFNNIPQTYDDLMLVVSHRNTGNETQARIAINGDTGSNYPKRWLTINNGSLGNYTDSSNFPFWTQTSGTTASTFGNSSMYFTNYAGSTIKSISVDSVTENNSATGVYSLIGAMTWSNTSAITSIALTMAANNFEQYSSASLYGIKRGSDGKTEVAAGGTITTSGGYTYHTFTSSGTFSANRNLTVDVLAIGGGGGGGSQAGGGGGAGGVLYAESYYVGASTYSVVVGSGGSGSSSASVKGNNGINSSFSALSAIGGGGGGSNSSAAGANGGSGGGGSGTGGPVGAGGSALQTSGTGFTGYGNAGGQSSNSNPAYGSGGGGGAGAAGANGTSGAGGNGGAGLNTWSAWATATSTGASGFYAGGGGASYGQFTGYTVGTGGSGGGGNGSINNANGGNATTNTGSGGGGGGYTNGLGGNGGSGVVIIRYLTPA